MLRGPQFPTTNLAHFNAESPRNGFGDAGPLRHVSQHGEYEVEHTFTPWGENSGGGGSGVIKLKHKAAPLGYAWDRGRGDRPAGTAASLKYDLDVLPRATSNRPQPVTHTEYISVDDAHQGKGLAQHMQSLLAAAHPGAPNVASNELTLQGARWRTKLAKGLRDPGMGQRIGYFTPEDEDDWDAEQGYRVFRPAPGQPRDALMEPGDLSIGGMGDEDFDDRRVPKKRKS